MAEFVYSLCVLTAMLCAILLFRGFRQTRERLLLWSGLCFLALAIYNALLIVDLYLVPTIDLFVLRTGSALLGMVVLLYGLILEPR